MMIKKPIYAFVVIIALSSSSCSPLGWGKFPSRMDAKEACDKWVKDSPTETYEVEVNLSKDNQEFMTRILRRKRDRAREELRKRPTKKIKKPYPLVGYYDPDAAAFGMINREFETEVENLKTKKITYKKERLIRNCREERVTSQFIGIEKNKKNYYRY